MLRQPLPYCFRSFVMFFILLSPMVKANNFAYCTGQITDIIIRNTSEAIQFQLETDKGQSGWLKIGADGSRLNDLEKAQLSLLISARMSRQPITVEMVKEANDFHSCQDFKYGTPVRFIRLRQ